MLDKQSRKLLKYISKHPELSVEELSGNLPFDIKIPLHHLYTNDYISFKVYEPDYAKRYFAMPIGKHYVETRGKNVAKEIIYVSGTLVALIKAFLPEITSGIQLIAQLLTQ